jgi:hypothetical protein
MRDGGCINPECRSFVASREGATGVRKDAKALSPGAKYIVAENGSERPRPTLCLSSRASTAGVVIQLILEMDCRVVPPSWTPRNDRRYGVETQRREGAKVRSKESSGAVTRGLHGRSATIGHRTSHFIHTFRVGDHALSLPSLLTNFASLRLRASIQIQMDCRVAPQRHSSQ